jgi:hypothetical protein
MVEFLSDFIIHCLSKDLNSCLFTSKENVTPNNAAELTLNSERFGSKIQGADSENDTTFKLDLSKSTHVMKYLGEDQVSRFIKKTLKAYKALRVLEREKNIETPFFSKSMEKLVRFLGRKFPEHLGLDGKLSDLAAQSNS